MVEEKYNTFESAPACLSANQVAVLLGISRSNAYAIMHSAGFPTIRIGKRMLVLKAELYDWLVKNSLKWDGVET